MNITITVADDIVDVCETEVVDLTLDLQRICAERVSLLAQAACEKANMVLSQNDPATLIANAGLPKLKDVTL